MGALKRGGPDVPLFLLAEHHGKSSEFSSFSKKRLFFSTKDEKIIFSFLSWQAPTAVY